MSEEMVERRDCFDYRQDINGDIKDVKNEAFIIQTDLKTAVETLIRTATILEETQKTTKTHSEMITAMLAAQTALISSQTAITQRQNTTEDWLKKQLGKEITRRDKLLQRSFYIITIIVLALLGLKELVGVPL